MSTERFLLTALPYSCADDADFHVSLFVSPDLLGDHPGTVLDEFRFFPHWADLMKNGQPVIELSDQQGIIDATPLLDPIDPAAWDAAFPPDTPVESRAMPDWSDRRWRTFDAAGVHDAAKLVHLLTVFSSPTDPPLPDASPLGRTVGRGIFSRDQQNIDESRLTAQLDEMLGEGQSGREAPSLERIKALVAGQENWLMRLALDLHRARRYYERPEADTGDYRERPVDGAHTEPMERLIPDFHQRVAMVGDHGHLMRALGLVIDLRVADPGRLRTSTFLSARILPGDDPSPCRPMRTACQSVGDDLVSVAGTSAWSEERLRIGDATQFSLLDVDADGSALKLERYLWTLPRLMASQRNGDPGHAASPALRAMGFTVSRTDRAIASQGRLGRQAELQNIVDHGEPPMLQTEDITRGYRVEVWDDTAVRWDTLHARRIDVEIDGHGVVLKDLLDDGFIQGTAANETGSVSDSPIHVHDALFGWEGWSLSVPKPGQRVRHQDGDEIVEDPETVVPKPGQRVRRHDGHEVVEDPEDHPDRVTPIVMRPRVEPGTLPRLRYGRSYAFRAWSADLAGNSRPHLLGGPVVPVEPLVGIIGPLLGAGHPLPGAAHLIGPLRGEVVAGLVEQATADSADAGGAADVGVSPGMALAPDGSTIDVLGALRPHLGAEIAASTFARLQARRTSASGGERSTISLVGRSSLVGEAFRQVLVDTDQPLVASLDVVDVERVSRLVAAAIDVDLPPALIGAVLDTVTPLRPFLRWDPVLPPAIVPRIAYTTGESLRQVVIRSGVTQDLDTLELTVTPPDEYAASLPGLDYHDISERHLAPPKTSQVQAELHGAFDDAIGSADPDVRRAALAAALREAGTFFDEQVPRLNDPDAFDPIDGVQLENEASVETADLVTLEELHDDPGLAPAPGQYVVHDVDQLVLPYLPDTVAKGLSIVFPDAGLDRLIPFPWSTEGFTSRFAGDWPELEPVRMVLDDSDVLTGDVTGNVLRFGVPAGERHRFRLACSLDEVDLDRFGIWRSLPPAVRANQDVIDAVVDGWLWAFTPFEEITLVHAVPRPLEAPRPTTLGPFRLPDSVESALFGAVDVHGPSTESITAEARWVEPVDDLSLPAPEDRPTRSVAFTLPIGVDEDLAVLGPVDLSTTLPGFGPITMHANAHHFGDTHHREVTYRFRAQTRYREYFDAEALAAPAVDPPIDPDAPVDDGQSVIGPDVVVSVPSSHRPAAPIVHSVIPLFRWDGGGEPEQPLGVRRRRLAGVRIYLERGWYSSGAGELLGLLIAPGGVDPGDVPYVSQWGRDPLWISAPVTRRTMALELEDLLKASGLDDRPGDALPIGAPKTFPLTSLPDQPTVAVLGYEPVFNHERQLWYVDVAIRPGDAFWPFVRLAVARYQPTSLPGCHLSAPVQCDFVQLPPERTLSVSRTDVRHVRVVLSGPVGFRTPLREGLSQSDLAFAAAVMQNRVVVATLQRRDPTIKSDLSWKTMAATILPIRGHGHDQAEAGWVGSLEAPVDLPLVQPSRTGDASNWRVHIEEWERLPGDPSPISVADDESGDPIWQSRLIYADDVPL